MVVRPDRLTKPHAIVTQIRQTLRGPKGEQYSAISGSGHAVFHTSPKSRQRALGLLDALFKTLDERRAMIQLAPVPRESDRYALSVTVAGKPPVEMWLTEHLKRSDHVMTEREQQMQARRGWSFAPKYDLDYSGQLTLEINAPWRERMRRRWADGKKQRLEDLLGEIVVGMELAAEGRRAQAEEWDRERRARDRDEEERPKESVAAITRAGPHPSAEERTHVAVTT